MALLAWTALGVWLLFCTVVDRADSPPRVAGKVAVVVLFSGLDVVGAQFTGHGLSATGHMEWWARLFQYSSNTTLLFWVPGHALPGWLAASILYRYQDHPWMIPILPGLLALLPLWSPLAAVGVLPLAASVGLAGLRRPGGWRQVDLIACAGATVVVGILHTYITADSGGIPPALGLTAASDPATARTVYLTFVFLEIALVYALVLCFDRSLIVLTAGLALFLLPFYRFGPANDFVMRASIPSLMIVALALADALQVAFSDPRLRALGWIGGFLLLLGAATPMTEFARAVSLPRWAPDPEKTVFDVTRGDHYLVRIRDTAAERVLKPVRYQAVR